MLRGIGNIGSPWVGAGVCLQVVADRAASKHFGDFLNLGNQARVPITPDAAPLTTLLCPSLAR
jgi:hypothetical protein